MRHCWFQTFQIIETFPHDALFFYINASIISALKHKSRFVSNLQCTPSIIHLMFFPNNNKNMSLILNSFGSCILDFISYSHEPSFPNLEKADILNLQPMRNTLLLLSSNSKNKFHSNFVVQLVRLQLNVLFSLQLNLLIFKMGLMTLPPL